MRYITALLLPLLAVPGPLLTQPVRDGKTVTFRLNVEASAVYLGGDFNQWEWRQAPLSPEGGDRWAVRLELRPGIYQYKFVVVRDTVEWMTDPLNPVQVLNYNESGTNSVITISSEGELLLQGYPTGAQSPMNDTYPRTGGTLYLNIIWHQHQPLYVDPGSDQLQGPWVRTHATKDYYDMTALAAEYPSVHVTVNLTSSLLHQLQEYYVDRLKPYVDTKRNRVDAARFLAEQRGLTDPWIDLALTPTDAFTETDRNFLLRNVWNAFGISEVMIARFPAYKGLKEKAVREGPDALSIDEQREVKFWFYLAHFDPDFLDAPARLITGDTVDLSDIVERKEDGTYHLRRAVTESDCNRIIAETFKICNAIVPLHRSLMYDHEKRTGQVEVLTTPYYHPILPLIYDSDLARVCQPNDPMPERFAFPEDADAQVATAVEYYRKTFGVTPQGMWPAEGSVAHDIVPVLSRRGIRWIATDEKVLYRSLPAGRQPYYPYAIHPKNGDKEAVVVVFRETELSDKIGFVYQNYRGEDAADDFIRSVLRYAPPEGEPDRLLTVILDGENAWEWYRQDNDGKDFQHALYRKLTALYGTRQIVTTTVSEYIHGNPSRNVPAHPVGTLPRIEWLWPGSWINVNFDTWIGEDEENRAWNYLVTARRDLEASGLSAPDPASERPKKGTPEWYRLRAWESMYAAEGSDWFWWYGTDQNAPAGDKPFDIAYITHVRNIYEFARKAGGKMPARSFDPIIQEAATTPRPSQGAMAQSTADMVRVVFRCNADTIYVRKSLFIVGDHANLGNWTPNTVRMFDDGTHGDDSAADNVWTFEADFPAGTVLEYKYTNSGPAGEWSPGEEFPMANRRVVVPSSGTKRLVLTDVFGRI